jgi:ABC-type branched-subunit amino acid transport system ATPase component
MMFMTRRALHRRQPATTRQCSERIRVVGLAKNYGQLPVFRGVDFAVSDREIIAVVGPSGCGKTTLLRRLPNANKWLPGRPRAAQARARRCLIGVSAQVDNQVAHERTRRLDGASATVEESRLESCSRVAERMRLYRKRRRQGLRSVRILLRVTEIDEFIRLGLLEEEQRESPEALQAVVVYLLHKIMQRLGQGWHFATGTDVLSLRY